MRTAIAAGLAALLCCSVAGAQTYPSKSIRYIVPFPAGGPPDYVARILADHLGRLRGQQVIVDNRTGVGGALGAGLGAKAPADGYTLFQCNIASNAMAPALYDKLGYDPIADFAPITRIGTTPNGFVVNPAFPVNTVAEFVANAKANPGRISYGSSGVGTSLHLGFEMFKLAAGIDVVHIAYKGAAQVLTDLIGGQIQTTMSNLPTLVAPVQAGRMRILAVTGATRAAQLPNAPTLIESGYPGFDVVSWYGLCAPAKTPQPVLERVHADLTKVLQTPEVRQRLAELAVDPSPTSRDAYGEFIRAELARWTQVVKAANIPKQ